MMTPPGLEAGTAGIPASVVNLIPNIGEVEARDDSGVGGALRVNIHCGEIVRAVLVRDYAGQVHYLLLGGGGKGSPWCGIAWSTTSTSSHDHSHLSCFCLSSLLQS